MEVYEVWPAGKCTFVVAKNKEAIKQAYNNRNIKIHIRKDINKKDVDEMIMSFGGYSFLTRNIIE